MRMLRGLCWAILTVSALYWSQPSISWAQDAVAVPANKLGAAVDPAAVKAADKLRPRLLSQMKRDSKLRGALVSPDNDPQSELLVKVTLVVDRDAPEISKDQYKTLIEEDIPSDKFELTVTPHPVNEILVKLRAKVTDDETLRDCRIEGIYFVDDSDPLSLIMEGLVTEETQRAKITMHCLAVVEELYKKDDPQTPAPKSTNMRVLAEPDPESSAIAAKLQQTITSEILKAGKARTFYGATVQAYREPKNEAVRFKVTLIVDSENSDVNLDSISQLVSKELPAKSHDPVLTQKHPIKAILTQLQKELAGRTQLQGACITDLYLELQDGEWTMQLLGAFSDAQQKESILNVANEVLALKYNGMQTPKAGATNLEQLNPDQDVVLAATKLEAVFAKLDADDREIYGITSQTQIDACLKSTKVDILVVVDKSATKATNSRLKGLEELAKKEFPKGTFQQIKVEHHPVAEILTELRKFILKSPSMSGCQIQDVSFRRTDGKWEFVLKGEYSRVTQREELTEQCNRLLASAYANSTDSPLTRTSELTLSRIAPADLISRINKRLAGKKSLVGARISDAVYIDTPEATAIDLTGSIAHTAQRSTLIDDANSALREFYGDEVPFQITTGKINVVYLPTEVVVTEIQRRIETGDARGLGGCQVTSAKYLATSDGESFLVLGRVGGVEQREVLIEVANDTLNDIYGVDWPRANTNQVALIRPSEELAATFFNMGLEYYLHGRFAFAERAFAQSVLENPLRSDFKYWQISAMIAQGQDEKAYERLRPIINQSRGDAYSYNTGYSGVMRSLERLQGPVRTKLRHLETRAYIEGPVPARKATN